MTRCLFKLNTSFRVEPMVFEELFEAPNASWSILYFKDVQLRVVSTLIGDPMTSTLKILSVHTNSQTTNCIHFCFLLLKLWCDIIVLYFELLVWKKCVWFRCRYLSDVNLNHFSKGREFIYSRSTIDSMKFAQETLVLHDFVRRETFCNFWKF